MVEGTPKLILVGYGDNLPLNEARQRFDAVQAVVDGIRVKYARPSSDVDLSAEAEKIDSKDNTLLIQCMGVLLPLSLQPSVQEEARKANPEEQADTLLARASDLQIEIVTYVSAFSNAGVVLLGYSCPQEGRPDLRLTGQTGK